MSQYRRTERSGDNTTKEHGGERVVFKNGLAGIVASRDRAELQSGGAIVVAAGGDLHLTSGGGAIIAAGGNTSVTAGGGQILVSGGEMRIKNGGGALLIAGRAKVENAVIGILLSGSTSPGANTRVLLNTSQAAVLGVALGLTFALANPLLRKT